MTITQNDVKFYKSEIMSDSDDSGGQMTSVVLENDSVNELFPILSRLDSTAGRLALRKVYLSTLSSGGTDTYYGSHTIITQPPENQNISCLMFSTNNSFDKQMTAKSKIEQYRIAGGTSPMTLVGDYPIGVKTIIVKQLYSVPLPSVGDVYNLYTSSYSQNVYIASVTDTGVSASYRTVVLEFSVVLAYAFTAATTTIKRTSINSTIEFCSIKPVEPITNGDSVINLDSIKTSIVPSISSTVNTGATYPFAASVLVDAGPLVTMKVEGPHDTLTNFAFKLPNMIKPGSLSVSFTELGTGLNDNGAAGFTAGASAGSIDYGTGYVIVNRDNTSPVNILGVSYIPQVESSTIGFTRGVEVTDSSLVYIDTLVEVELYRDILPKTVKVSYVSQGNAVVLQDYAGDGTIYGGSSLDGVGTINYSTGDVAVTLTYPPDLGTHVIFTWVPKGITEYLAQKTDKYAYYYADATEVKSKLSPGYYVKSSTSTSNYGDVALDGVSKAVSLYMEGLPTSAIQVGGVGKPGYFTTLNGIEKLLFYTNGTLLPEKDSTLTLRATTSYGGLTNTHASQGTLPIGNYHGQRLTHLEILDVSCNITILLRVENGTYTTYQIPINGKIQIDTTTWAGYFITDVEYSTSGTSYYGNYNIVVPVGEFDAGMTISPTATTINVRQYDGATTSLGTPTVLITGDGGVSVTGSIWNHSNTHYHFKISRSYTTVAPDGSTVIATDDGILEFLPGTEDVEVEMQFTIDKLHLDNCIDTTSDSQFRFGGYEYVTDIGSGHIFRYETNDITVGSTIYDGYLNPSGLRLDVSMGMFNPSLGEYTLSSWVARNATMSYADASAPQTALRASIVNKTDDIADYHNKLFYQSKYGNITKNTVIVNLAGTILQDDGLGGLTNNGVLTIANAVNYDAGQICFETSGTSLLLERTIIHNSERYEILNVNTGEIDASSLPADGKVPVFSVGSVVVIHKTDESIIASPAAEAVYTVSGAPFTKMSVRQSDGVFLVEGIDYTENLGAGSVTMSVQFSGTIPITVRGTHEEMNLVSGVTLNTIKLASPVNSSFGVGTYISKALVHGDKVTYASKPFDQSTWTSVWSDSLIGSDSSANYNSVAYPVVISSTGAVTERWRLNFTSSTAFQIIGETVGVIGTGTTATSISPINPVSGTPYFTINHLGFGTGWAAGNQLRFNTYSPSSPIWFVRVVTPGAAVTGDHFEFEGRGDII